MKEKTYIITRLITKSLLPLLLFIVSMVSFFVNLINRPVAYASEYVANVECSVNLVNGKNVENLSFDRKLISSLDDCFISFSDIDVKLDKNSRIEIDYVIENIMNYEQRFNIEFSKKQLKNFNVDYSINGGNFNCLDKLYQNILAEEVVQIKVVISIADVKQNAALGGDLKLTFNI